MITTFVIGAAASKNLISHYPLGSQLKQMIATGVPHCITHSIGTSGSFLPEQLRRSPLPSIDAFMANATEPESLLARQCIAGYLLPLEYHAIGHGIVDYDWFAELATRFANKPDLLLQRKYRFVVFNYDRLLEIALYSLFSERGKLTPENAWSKVKQCAIEHVYGHLEYDLPSLLANPELLKRYEAPLHSYPHRIHCKHVGADAIIAANGIRLVTSSRNEFDDNRISRIREWVSESSRLVFIGFGFAAENVKIIGASQFADRQITGPNARGDISTTFTRVFASLYDSGEAERRRVVRLISRTGDRVLLGPPEKGCLHFLRHSCVDWLESDAEMY